MVELTRTVRFCINPPGAPGSDDKHNTFSAFPPMRGLGRYYEIDVRCKGDADPRTGYFINISEIDRAVRDHAIPLLQEACHKRPHHDPASLLAPLLEAVNTALQGRVAAALLRLSPYYSVEMNTDTPDTVTLRQSFEIAASHRLHCDDLSDEDNRRIFGKCNNPSGHGHNYRIEPAVTVRITDAQPAATLPDIERVTRDAIIDRFDHKNLNEDTTEFAATGLNPSVENIARVFFDLLEPQIAKLDDAGRVRLARITVWETEKTSCSFPA